MQRQKDIRKILVEFGRKIVNERLVLATGGNISARNGNCIYIKAKSARLDSPDVKTYVSVNLQSGKCKDGIPSSEACVHIACYKARKDINAIFHLHPVFSTTVANADTKIKFKGYELLSCLGSEVVRSRYKPAGSEKLADEMKKCVKKSNAILMPNHGILVVGKDANEAFDRALAVERACQAFIFSHILKTSSLLNGKLSR